jgi:soluble lytic murein transglycosylase-like protein
LVAAIISAYSQTSSQLPPLAGEQGRLAFAARQKAPRDLKPFLVVLTPVPNRAYRYEFKRLMSELDRIDRFDAIIARQARRFDMDPRLVKAIIAAESDFKTGARSPHGAQGLMQLLPSTAEALGLPKNALNDPEGNIEAGTAYLRFLFDEAWRRFKLRGVDFASAPPWMVQRIIAAYNAGPRSLERYRWRAETRSYVRKVVLFYQSEVSVVMRSGPSQS